MALVTGMLIKLSIAIRVLLTWHTRLTYSTQLQLQLNYSYSFQTPLPKPTPPHTTSYQTIPHKTFSSVNRVTFTRVWLLNCVCDTTIKLCVCITRPNPAPILASVFFALQNHSQCQGLDSTTDTPLESVLHLQTTQECESASFIHKTPPQWLDIKAENTPHQLQWQTFSPDI